eukprot:5908356-Pyramimonas_sp.AAC.1
MRGISSTPKGCAGGGSLPRSLYAAMSQSLAWRFLNTKGGAQGVVPHCGLYTRQCRGAEQAWH